MSDNKNIDRLFQEKFKDFEVAPNAAVWERISESLPHKPKKKRRVIAFWWQIGGIAAAIALLLTVGVSIFNYNESPNTNIPVVNTDSNTDSNTKEDAAIGLKKAPKTKVANTNKNSQVKEETSATKAKILSNELTTPNASRENAVANTTVTNKTKTAQKGNSTTTNIDDKRATKVAANTNNNTNSENSGTTTLTSKSNIKSVIKNTVDNNTSAVTNNDSKKNSNKNSTVVTDNSDSEATIKENSTKESILEAIAQNTDNPITEKEEDKQNRWSIAPNVAPVYFSSLGQGSSIDQQFNENAKSSDVNMSYGITGTYAVSKKLRIRSGINRVDLSQTTSDVFAFTGAETASRGVDAQFSNISFSNGVQTVSLMSSKMLDRSSAPELFNTKIAGNVDQRFGFIEVPLELEYRLVDKKFGVNVIGGFSTFFLNENELYADIDGVSTLIGDANNVNATSFSANFGLGLDYRLSKQWNINLEPTFKYQINTFNNTSGDFRPFFIGVYTGLSFKF